MRKFLLTSAILAMCFAKALLEWFTFAFDSDLFSYCLLIPVVSAYLVWSRRNELDQIPQHRSALAWIPGLCGLLILLCWWSVGKTSWNLARQDYVALMILAFWLLLMAAALFFIGARTLWTFFFPAVFLLFMSPFPTFLQKWIAVGLQYGSAEVSHWFLKLAGMPVLRTDTVFQLPGFRMEVAPQCSGIHSTLVLMIVSIVGSYLFLRRPVNRLLLVFAVIPLALLRNGLRIFTIGQLCVHVSPEMINSYIHKQGGPIFFALSLVPFFLLLLSLRHFEIHRSR